MTKLRVGVSILVTLGALETGACTFGPSDAEFTNTDAGAPSNTGGSATGGRPATGGAHTGGRGTGGRRNTGGAGGGASATGGSSGGASSGGSGGGATGGASTGGVSRGGAGGSTGGTSSGGAGGDASVPDGSVEGGTGCGSCPAGQYCDLQSLVCRPGCGSGAMCASGSCSVSHDCDRCVSDTECAEGRVCSTGRCLSPCTSSLDCPSGYTCCGNRCADTSRDYDHCASCSVACTGGDYCSAVGCKRTSVATACDTTHMTFLLDGSSVDDALTPVISAALVSGCSSPPATAIDPETASTAVNPTTAQPVAGPADLLVELGGPYTSNTARYVESRGYTRIYDTTPDGIVVGFYGRSADGGSDPEVAVTPILALTATHDFFKIEMVVDPVSGTRVLQIYGIFSPGTAAAAWFFENRMLPNLSAYPLRYYVYEWTHGDAGQNPGASDTFTLLASGN